MSNKRKRTIDLTAQASSSAFDPRMLLNPRAMLRKQASSPEKEFDAATAIEKLHKVQPRRRLVQSDKKKENSKEDKEKPEKPEKSTYSKGSGIIGKDLQDASRRQIAKSVETNGPLAVISISDEDEDADDIVEVKAGTKVDNVCFGMLKATINAFSIPAASDALPDRWPTIECTLDKANGMVINVLRHDKKFGVVSSETAGALSRLLQLDLIWCTARIPSRPRYARDQDLTGVSAILPLEIIVYGDSAQKERISVLLSQRNCFLIQPTNYDQSYVYVNPHVRQSFKPSGNGTQYGTSSFRTAEEIKSEIESLFNQIQTATALADHPQPEELRSPLLKHQKQALTFCLDRESSSSNHSVWQESIKAGKKIWKNKITPQILYQEPRNALGGLVCDEMGLGKTLSMLALICATRTEAAKFAKGLKVKSTLIVCPLSVLTNWVEQASSHLYPDSLTILVHHDKTRVYDLVKFRSYDIVLTTYATIGSEHKHKDDPDRETILPALEFFRVVLDEAHTIKESATLASQAAVAIEGRNRWCITATPVQNSLNDLAALFSFLHLDPFHNRAVWNQYISQPMKSGDSIAVTRLRTLLKMRVLRRTKAIGEQAEALLSLPPRNEEIRLLKLELEEQDLYNVHLEQYQRQNSASSINVLQNINTLRQICLSTALVEARKVKDQQNELSLEELEELVDGEVCAICQAVVELESVDTCAYYAPKCLHIFCHEHGQASASAISCVAPGCHGRGPVKPLASIEDHQSTADQSHPLSTKIKALITDICNIKDNDPDDVIKSVVFSQFTSFLNLLGAAFTAMGMPYARLDGSMNRDERAKQLDRFKDNPEIRVILVSTRAGGVGLNLTMASRVFLMEPSWNPMIEHQAADRCHRIGQTRPVVITRYVIAESIESTMLKLQTQKRNLVNLSLSSKIVDEGVTKSLLELRKLL